MDNERLVLIRMHKSLQSLRGAKPPEIDEEETNSPKKRM